MTTVFKYLVPVLKVVIPLVIIGWLLTMIDASQWEELQSRPKHWGLLAIAFVIELVAVCLTFVRWYLLVHALDIPFALTDAFRLSFLGFLLNFVSAGSVGGDLFKAIFIAREQHARKAEAVATVVADRVIGLYALLAVASIAILLTGSRHSDSAYIALSQFTLWATLVCLGSVILLMFSGMTRGPMHRRISSVPRVGKTFQQIAISVQVYRRRYFLMAGIFAMSMAVHSLAAAALYLVASAIFVEPPTLVDHFVIVPLSMAAGALPITPSGLGSFEFAMDELYRIVYSGSDGTVSGVLVALVYRLVTIAIAAIGVVYYWTSRAKVKEVLGAAEAKNPKE